MIETLLPFTLIERFGYKYKGAEKRLYNLAREGLITQWIERGEWSLTQNGYRRADYYDQQRKMKHKLKVKGNSKLKRGSNCFLLLTKRIFCSIMKLVLMMNMKLRVTSRQIAKLLVRNLPDNAGKVDEYTKVIETMPEESKLALQSAYIFSSKVPPEERGDMFQELFCQVLEAFNKQKVTDIEQVKHAFAYTAGKFRLWNWEQKRKRRQKHFGGSLNEVITDEDGNEIELIDTLIGENDFEDKLIATLEAQRIWDELPDTIKPIIKKKLRGEPLLVKEQSKLERFRQKKRGLTTGAG